MFLARQGDLLIESVGVIPQDLTRVAREGGRVILARGEATGHHHAVAEPDVELFAPGEASEAADRFLRVGPKGANLVHEEHATIALPPGEYRVSRQREYQPAELPRYVAD